MQHPLFDEQRYSSIDTYPLSIRPGIEPDITAKNFPYISPFPAFISTFLISFFSLPPPHFQISPKKTSIQLPKPTNLPIHYHYHLIIPQLTQPPTQAIFIPFKFFFLKTTKIQGSKPGAFVFPHRTYRTLSFSRSLLVGYFSSRSPGTSEGKLEPDRWIDG